MDKNFDLNLHHIAERVIREEISLMLEYAHPRKLFIERVERLFTQITIHYFLIKYHANTEYSININHWKTEIMGWITTLVDIQIKGNDSEANRFNAISNAIENVGYLNDETTILNCVSRKAKKENVDMNNSIIHDIVKLYQHDLITIMRFIANKNLYECDKFISTL